MLLSEVGNHIQAGSTQSIHMDRNMRIYQHPQLAMDIVTRGTVLFRFRYNSI